MVLAVAEIRHRAIPEPRADGPPLAECLALPEISYHNFNQAVTSPETLKRYYESAPESERRHALGPELEIHHQGARVLALRCASVIDRDALVLAIRLFALKACERRGVRWAGDVQAVSLLRQWLATGLEAAGGGAGAALDRLGCARPAGESGRVSVQEEWLQAWCGWAAGEGSSRAVDDAAYLLDRPGFGAEDVGALEATYMQALTLHGRFFHQALSPEGDSDRVPHCPLGTDPDGGPVRVGRLAVSRSALLPPPPPGRREEGRPPGCAGGRESRL